MVRVNAFYPMFNHKIEEEKKKKKGLLSVENERRNFQICLLGNGDTFYTIFSLFKKTKQKKQLKTETDYF